MGNHLIVIGNVVPLVARVRRLVVAGRGVANIPAPPSFCLFYVAPVIAIPCRYCNSIPLLQFHAVIAIPFTVIAIPFAVIAIAKLTSSSLGNISNILRYVYGITHMVTSVSNLG